ncbi:D-glycerate dehydrogenase [Paenibacillus filicis]|uniref:D-glycerate dehydrogenase n=1 Tax=Paenibacillus gyeongsangnamensis TaxID=3388067 RepID=A0ABT4QGF7_9BACL|nr:D-glycerate dehydrogenase [Paenibacillus filicis]MCZ8515939.1 D-glycerate dehydrogenase [Paenibacillus filicis]
MSKPKIYITKKIPDEVLAFLEQHCECRMWDGRGTPSREGLLGQLAEVEGLLTSSGPIDGELLARAPKLRVVSSISVGYNHFDTEAMKARGVIGTNTPYVLDDTVADLVLSLMLASARRIPELDHFVKQGMWKKGAGLTDEDFFGLDVHHATLGIIGMGRIGEAIAKRAVHGFDMKLLYHNRSRRPETEERFHARFCGLEELLEQSDFVVLMTPLTPETQRFMRKEHFDRMKRSAFFINASRGQTVDEQALIEALQNGTIRGAGLDVFDTEPVQPDNPLLQMPNVVTLPHIGSATAKTRLDMAMTAAHNLVDALAGRKPQYVVSELRSLVE